MKISVQECNVQFTDSLGDRWEADAVASRDDMTLILRCMDNTLEHPRPPIEIRYSNGGFDTNPLACLVIELLNVRP
jgi:hypothetical protein